MPVRRKTTKHVTGLTLHSLIASENFLFFTASRASFRAALASFEDMFALLKLTKFNTKYNR